MAGYQNPLQSQLDAATAQNQSYQQQLAALQHSLSGANAYHPSYTTQPTAQVPTYTPPITANWNPAASMQGLASLGLPPQAQQSTSSWSPSSGLSALIAEATGGAGGASAGGK